MAKWNNKNKSKNKQSKQSSGMTSWLEDSGLDSGLQTELDQGSQIDFIPAYEEDEEFDSHLRSNIKGIPVIGRLNKFVQYALASTGIFISGGLFLGGFWYSHQLLMEVQAQKASVNEIAILMDKVQSDTQYFAALNKNSLENLKESKNAIDKDFLFLKESKLQESKNLDILFAKWQGVKQATNIVLSSSDLITSVKSNIKSVNDNINKQSNTILTLLGAMSKSSNVSQAQIAYLAQINSIFQRINSNLYQIGNEDANYSDLLNSIDSDNNLLPKAMSALIDGRLGVLPDNIRTALTNVSGQYQPANAMILNTTQKLNLITKSVSSNRSLGENYNNYISSLKLDVENLMDLINFYQKLVWLFAILTALFVTLLMAINISESKKNYMIVKAEKNSMDQEINKVLEDLNIILQGDLNHRVQNKPGKLLTLSDFINSVLDKISEEFEKQLNIVGSLRVNYKNYESENTEIASSLSIQEGNLSNVMDYMKLLNNSFTDVKKAVIATNKLIDKHEKEFKNGALSLPNYISHTNEALEKTNDINERVVRLKDSIEEMMDISNNLLSVSEKMDVLSLHASVQIAKKERASEGFNIVAEDFGKMAKKMQAASERIHTLTNATNSDIRSTLGTLDEINNHLIDLLSVTTKIENTVDSNERLKDDIKRINVDTTSTADRVDKTAKSLMESFQAIIKKNENISKLSEEFKSSNKTNNTLLNKLYQNINQMIKKEEREE